MGESITKERGACELFDPPHRRSTLKPANVMVHRCVEGKHVCVDLTRVSPLV